MGCPAPKLSQIRKSDWEEGNELTSTVQLAKLIFSRGGKEDDDKEGMGGGVCAACLSVNSTHTSGC